MQAVKCDSNDQQCSNPDTALPVPVGEAYYQSVLNTSEEALEDGLADIVSGPLLGSAHTVTLRLAV